LMPEPQSETKSNVDNAMTKLLYTWREAGWLCFCFGVMRAQPIRRLPFQTFRKNLKWVRRKNPELRGALQRARQDGCTAANLIGFLYHYSFGNVLVLGPRRAARRDILARLAVLARKVESTAADTKQLLQRPCHFESSGNWS
jgi:hypothetical protein